MACLRRILADLADWSREPGRWFAAARDDGYLDVALGFAQSGRTEPRTLSRAARDFLGSEPLFALRIGRLAVERILAGDGNEITALELLSACDDFLAAAGHLGIVAEARQELAQIVMNYPNAPWLFRGLISRRLNESPAGLVPPDAGME